MKIYILLLAVIVTFLSSCFKDKGNYTYEKLTEVTVQNIPDTIEVLGYLDHIVIRPKLTSSIDGEIITDSENYSCQYRIGVQNQWVDLIANEDFSIDIPAEYSAGLYPCWLTITDKRTNTFTSHSFVIKVNSTTREGWMVLCNEGSAERVRLDFISLLSSIRTEPIYDIAQGLPTLHHGTQIGFHPDRSSQDIISVLSKDGSYLLDPETLGSDPLKEFNLNSFLTAQTETMTNIYTMSVTGDYYWLVRHSFLISDAGNLYAQTHGQSGSTYGLAVNVNAQGEKPNYRVAPFVGFSPVRPANSASALLFDRDNKRFMAFSSSSPYTLRPVEDKAGSLFSFQTGKDLLYMENTRRSNGLVYSILQDAQGNRSIYGINMGGNGFLPESYYPNLNIQGFKEATMFAFHSQYPIVFYSNGTHLYSYDMSTAVAKEITNWQVNPGEQITCLKFNLFRNSNLAYLNNQTTAFMNQQFQLIIGSYDSSTSNNNGGRVSFNEVDGYTGNILPIKSYSGFAKIKDIVYRER
jgi:hypothetical protein